MMDWMTPEIALLIAVPILILAILNKIQGK